MIGVKVGYFGYVIGIIYSFYVIPICYLFGYVYKRKGVLYLFNSPQDLFLLNLLHTFTKIYILSIQFCYYIYMTLLEIKKFILSRILGRKYYRTGKCNACGKCCRQIYVKHYKHVIQDEDEFKKLQYLHRFYTYLKVIGKDEIGLVFECTNLDPETHKCKIHKNRPGICRRYPQEELFSMGGALSDDCGYRMEPIIPFSKILEKTEKQFNKKKNK